MKETADELVEMNLFRCGGIDHLSLLVGDSLIGTDLFVSLSLEGVKL